MRRELFYELMNVVWKNDLRGTIRILVKNLGIVHYSGFTFHLPEQTNSIIDYAERLGHETIVEVLRGFAAA